MSYRLVRSSERIGICALRCTLQSVGCIPHSDVLAQRTHEADEALSSGLHTLAHHAHTKVTEAARLASLTPPSLDIDQFLSRSSLVVSNSWNLPSEHRTYWLCRSCPSDSRETPGRQHCALAATSSAERVSISAPANFQQANSAAADPA